MAPCHVGMERIPILGHWQNWNLARFGPKSVGAGRLSAREVRRAHRAKTGRGTGVDVERRDQRIIGVHG